MGLVERLCDLPFQPQSFWKRGVVAGLKIVQSTASQWNGPFFVFVLFFLFSFCFLFLFLFFSFFFFFFFFLSFCLFVCLIDFFNHLVQALNWFQKEPPNKMKNKYLCWIVENYAVCLSIIFIWNLFEVVGKVHVGPLILNFVFVCFCLFVCLFFNFVLFLRQIQSQVACA